MVIDEILNATSMVALGGHIRPDGDCVGSCMGLYWYLKENYPNLKVDVFLEEIPEHFRFIQDIDVVKHEADEKACYDLFIALDCGDSSRLGFAEPLFRKTARTACIDHHISNKGFADINYIKPYASSTSELVYELVEKEGISKAAAECLYLGIVHDTGVFQYTAAKPSTMEAAAELMRKGVDAAGIIERTYYEKSYKQMKVTGFALVNSELQLNGKCITSILTNEELVQFGVTTGDLDGIAGLLRNTRGVEAVVFLYEQSPSQEQDKTFKVSLRSGEKVDVSRIASEFGGGGHRKAAGFTVVGAAAKIISAVLKKISEQLDEE